MSTAGLDIPGKVTSRKPTKEVTMKSTPVLVGAFLLIGVWATPPLDAPSRGSRVRPAGRS